jgi:hypothetical protein
MASVAAPTSNVNAVASGATNSGSDASSFTTDQIAKAAKDEEAALVKGLEETRKAAEQSVQGTRKRDGWSLDLNSPEFLEGKRTIDFGSDGTARTA